jgi:hypothetical protein
LIAEVSRALAGYEKLSPVGKRLFRDELGLVRPQQAKPRKARKAKVAKALVDDSVVAGVAV